MSIIQTEIDIHGSDTVDQKQHTLLYTSEVRVDAIQRLGPPKTPKECKKFCGLINYLSMYLKDFQKRLIPIYNLTGKGVSI